MPRDVPLLAWENPQAGSASEANSSSLALPACGPPCFSGAILVVLDANGYSIPQPEFCRQKPRRKPANFMAETVLFWYNKPQISSGFCAVFCTV
jgi:hypothetical protein